jgi:putative transposase
MPRQARIVLPGKLHHVTQRGNFQQNVFFDDQDRAVYLKYVNDNAQKYEVQIYAFCLMDNHVHFIVKPSRPDSLAAAFRVSHQKYSLYLNQRLKEHGHRWQSRYYSCVVLGEHIQRVFRYVERNPVRAKIVKYPWHYSWSSARAHLGENYKIIMLADIKEYVGVPSWKEYLLQDESEKDLSLLRTSTLQGRIYGPAEIIADLQKRFKQNLLPQPKGRPKLSLPEE